MSENTTTTLTPDEAKAARADAKAKQEKARRASIATAKAHLENHGLLVRLDGTKIVMKDPREDTTTEEVVLDTEQRDRAATAGKTHGGLSGKSLAVYVLTGQSSKEQIAAAKKADAAAAKTENQRANVTRSADPAATEIAQRAREFAGVKSAFLPKEGRAFIDGFTVTVDKGVVSVKRPGAQGIEGAAEEGQLGLADLKKFAKGEELDADAKKAIRQTLSGLGKGTVLWGRKLAALLVVRAEDAKKS